MLESKPLTGTRWSSLEHNSTELQQILASLRNDRYAKFESKDGEFLFDLHRPMYSEAHFFDRSQGLGFFFNAILLGHNNDNIHSCCIVGDCGNAAFRCSQTLNRLKFASWIGYSHADYLLTKSGDSKVFDWDLATNDFETWFDKDVLGEICDRHGTQSPEADKAVAVLDEIKSRWRSSDFQSEQDFCEALYVDDVEYYFIPSDIIGDHQFGRRYSCDAMNRWRQLRFFGRWLLAREGLLDDSKQTT